MTTAPAYLFDPYDYATQEDPYPAYAWLRANAPLYENTDQGFWALSRHADVVAAFRSEGTFSNKMGVTLDESAWGPNASAAMSFLAMDPPDQTRLRKLVSQGFTPRRVKELEPRIREITRSYVEPMIEAGSADFIAEFAGRLPMDVISEMLGVAPSERQELRRLADLLVHRDDGMRDVPPEGVEAFFALHAYYTELLADRRKHPRDDLTSALVVAEVDGDRLSQDEIIAFLLLMIVAGNETTTKLLGNALYWADRFPAQLRGVLAAGGQAPPVSRVTPWVEETLRFDGSTQLLARYLLQDVQLYGQTAPAGSKLVLLIGSANRDEGVFPAADQYDLDRDTSQMCSFGGGRHYCLGANLARLEANIALDELVSRVGAIEVDGANAVRVHSVNVRGFAALPVTLHAR